MTQPCAAACTPTCEAPPVKVARVRFDPARGQLVGTFGDGVTMESADPRELAGRMFVHGARHGHVSTPDWRESDTAPAGGHRIAFHARLTVATNESSSGVMRASHALSFHDPLDTFAQSVRPNRAAAVALACSFHHAATKLARAPWHVSQRRAPASIPSSPRNRQSAVTGCVKCPMVVKGGRSGHRCCSMPNSTARPHKSSTKA